MGAERTENFEKGVALRRLLGGDKLVDEAFRDPVDFGYPMEELVTEVAWTGAVAASSTSARSPSSTGRSSLRGTSASP